MKGETLLTHFDNLLLYLFDSFITNLCFVPLQFQYVVMFQFLNVVGNNLSIFISIINSEKEQNKSEKPNQKTMKYKFICFKNISKHYFKIYFNLMVCP